MALEMAWRQLRHFHMSNYAISTRLLTEEKDKAALHAQEPKKE
jgi:hypothetical protein